jgi:hypothetical protein
MVAFLLVIVSTRLETTGTFVNIFASFRERRPSRERLVTSFTPFFGGRSRRASDSASSAKCHSYFVVRFVDAGWLVSLPTIPRARGGAGAAAPFGQVRDVDGAPVVTPSVKLAQWKAAHGVPSGPNAAVSNQIRPLAAVIASA